FPQQRGAFLVGLALWCAVCAYASTLFASFASYAASLAGYTAAIIAADQLGATGGPAGNVFLVAVERTTEICIGIVSAGIVLAAPGPGPAPRRPAGRGGSLWGGAARHFIGAFAESEPVPAAAGNDGRELVRRVVAANPVIDEAIGESTSLHDHSPTLHGAVDG